MNPNELLGKLKEAPGNTRVFGGLTKEEIDKTEESAWQLNREKKIKLIEVGRQEGYDGIYIKATVTIEA